MVGRKVTPKIERAGDCLLPSFGPSKTGKLLARRRALDFTLQQCDFHSAICGPSSFRFVVFDLLGFPEAEDEHTEQRNLVLLRQVPHNILRSLLTE